MSERYLFILFDDEATWVDAPPEEWDRLMAAHDRFSKAVAAAGAVDHGGEALQPTTTATTVRNGPEPVVTDGPFVESKEAFGGYYVIECDGLDAALALAKQCPSAVVEVRPILEIGGE
ncbi:YciI family protein [Mumia sp. DW29H23]|uniref:YciI family protein n=1 Tax=Mumia sp. DW29H23 TaxID=3421241 RepID=UPI003D688A10